MVAKSPARRSAPPAALDLPQLLASWEVALRAERKSRATVQSYSIGVRRYLAWCAERDRTPELTRRAVAEFVADLLDTGAAAATAKTRHTALVRFSAWLYEEGETEQHQLVGSKSPRLDEKVTPRLTEEQLVALIKACQGKSFHDRRDEAVVRILLETGMRAGECVAVELSDVDVARGLVIINRGKGGRGRIVPIGPATSRSLDRYIRARRSHRLADTAVLWLGDRGKGFGYSALQRSLGRRATVAGIAGFHPHVLRHTAASRWLTAGGSEGGLMTVAGWTRRDMIDRYSRVTAADRAVDEARGLGLGEL